VQLLLRRGRVDAVECYGLEYVGVLERRRLMVCLWPASECCNFDDFVDERTY
jgi:hypothetical protein